MVLWAGKQYGPLCGNNWASKDYTHLGFGGGRQLARILMDALMSEMEFYESAGQE